MKKHLKRLDKDEQKGAQTMEEIRDHVHMLVGEDKNEESPEVKNMAEQFHRELERLRKMSKLGDL